MLPWRFTPAPHPQPPTPNPALFNGQGLFTVLFGGPVKHTCSEIFSSFPFLRAIWVQLGSDCASKDKSHAPSSPLHGSKPGPPWFSFPPSMRLFHLQFCLACWSTLWHSSGSFQDRMSHHSPLSSNSLDSSHSGVLNGVTGSGSWWPSTPASTPALNRSSDYLVLFGEWQKGRLGPGIPEDDRKYLKPCLDHQWHSINGTKVHFPLGQQLWIWSSMQHICWLVWFRSLLQHPVPKETCWPTAIQTGTYRMKESGKISRMTYHCHMTSRHRMKRVWGLAKRHTSMIMLCSLGGKWKAARKQ